MESNKIKYYKSERTLIEILCRIGKRFAFTRYGDGEILMMNGRFEGKEVNQLRNERLIIELREGFMINDPDYLIGRNSEDQREELAKPGLFEPDQNDYILSGMCDRIQEKKKIYSAIPFHYTYKFHRDLFNLVFNKIKESKVLLVGGEHLKEWAKKEGFLFVGIPSQQAYDTIEEWYPRLKTRIEEDKPQLVLSSGGMASNVAQKRIWLDGLDVGTIDFGSPANALSNWEGSHHSWIINN